MDSREKLEKQRLKAEKQRQEDIALTKVLYWIVGAVVLEFLLLMTQKYYINFTHRTSRIKYKSFAILHICLYICEY